MRAAEGEEDFAHARASRRDNGKTFFILTLFSFEKEGERKKVRLDYTIIVYRERVEFTALT